MITLNIVHETIARASIQRLFFFLIRRTMNLTRLKKTFNIAKIKVIIAINPFYPFYRV